MENGKILLYNNEVVRQDEIRQFIDENLGEELNIKILSSRFAISESTLLRHFRSCYNESVSSYVHKCRMRKSMELITAHVLPISQVGMTVGYNHRSSFTHAFKKFFGNPPVHFLRNDL